MMDEDPYEEEVDILEDPIDDLDMKYDKLGASVIDLENLEVAHTFR